MRGVLIFAIVGLAIPVRPDRHAHPVPPPAPTTQIQGRWQLVQYQLNGKSMPQTTIDNLSITIEGSELHIESKSAKKITATYAFQFDPSKTPAAFDFTSKTAPSAVKFSGILKVEGDLMTFTFTRGDGAERPKQFDVPADFRGYLWQMRRMPDTSR